MWAAFLANGWRLLCALMDWRAALRWLMGRPIVDVVIITNVRDEAERYRFWGCCLPKEGHSNGARIYINDVAGRVRGICTTAEEMLTKQGRQLAKTQFISAVQWADRQGAKVVLLAASTKRLFGRDGTVLKGMFPHITFTIGDNGTAQMLCSDIENAFTQSQINAAKAKVLVIGPYGILGSVVTQYLVDKQFHVQGFGTNIHALQELQERFPIELFSNPNQLSKVDAVVACTHSPDAKLTEQLIHQLRKHNKKLLVVDVAEPANLDAAVYTLVKSHVVRQDAGNAFSKKLHYVLGGISSGMLYLPSHVVFGCFAESLALYHGIYKEHNHHLLNQDWFLVNKTNMALIKDEFLSLAIDTPEPCCFGNSITEFNLDMQSEMFNQSNFQCAAH
jgi:predicted amino acid dehydrogenase